MRQISGNQSCNITFVNFVERLELPATGCDHGSPATFWESSSSGRWKLAIVRRLAGYSLWPTWGPGHSGKRAGRDGSADRWFSSSARPTTKRLPRRCRLLRIDRSTVVDEFLISDAIESRAFVACAFHRSPWILFCAPSSSILSVFFQLSFARTAAAWWHCLTLAAGWKINEWTNGVSLAIIVWKCQASKDN